MKGLELSRAFYEECGAPMLHDVFAERMPYIAVGLVGAGSECFGYDDALSRDHDFEPGFCLFLPGEDLIDRKTAFSLERAYARLPREYCGYRRLHFSPEGGARHGVIRTSEFYFSKTGSKDGRLTTDAWLRLPEYYLAEATNGEVFIDPYGEFTEIRRRLLQMPEDVRLKKMAGHLWLAAQSGQYNYARCYRHGESGGAQWAIFEFTKHAGEVLFLLNRRYAPFYKWRMRALSELPVLGTLSGHFEKLLTTDNSEALFREKKKTIDEISEKICMALRQDGKSNAEGADLSRHAVAVNDLIADHDLRTDNLLCAVSNG